MKFGINRTFILVTIIILLFLPAKGEKNKIKMPEIFPVQDKENPELYFSGVEIINYSFIKYKDAILDLLKDTTFRNWGEIRALFEDKNSIEKETITRHRCENGEPVHLPLHLNGKKNTPPNKLHNGLYAFKINRLVAQNKSNDLKLKNMVENITGRIKLFHKKEIDFVVRAGHKKILVWVYNNKTQKGIPNANVFLLRKKRAAKFTKATTSTKATKSTTSTKSTMSTPSTRTIPTNKRIKIGQTNPDGICTAKITVTHGDFLVAVDPKTNQKSFYRMAHGESFDFDDEEERETQERHLAAVFTDRILYKPGSTVHIGGVVKSVVKGVLKNSQLKSVTIIVENDNGDVIKKEDVKTDELGGFVTTCQLDKKCEKGEYEIVINLGKENQFAEAFLVDYYQPDAIKLELSDEKKVYGKNELFNPKVSGNYYSGNPMSGDKLNYHLTINDGEPFRGRGSLKGYHFHADGDFSEYREKPPRKKATFDRNGTFRPEVDLAKIKKASYIHALHFEITGETDEGKEASLEMHAHYFPADRAVGLRLPNRVAVGEPINLKLAVIDSSIKPAETRASISVCERGYTKGGEFKIWNTWKKIKEYKGLTFKGKDSFTLESLPVGPYLIRCDAVDDDGDILSTSLEIFVGMHNSYDGDELKIDLIRAKVPGEKFITLSIEAPEKGTALFTIENKKSLGYHLVTLDTPYDAKKVRIPIAENYFPTVEINAFVLYESGISGKDRLWVDIPESSKKLNVEIIPEAKELPPYTPAKLTVKVTDNQGKGKKTRVFVYAVNEATLCLTEWIRDTDLLERFYHYRQWNFLTKMTTLLSMTQNNLFPALSSTVWKGNTGCIAGRVSAEDGTPLPGVMVHLEGPPLYNGQRREKKEILTNKNGFFFMLGSHDGLYKLEFHKKGYKITDKKVYLTMAGVEEVTVTLIDAEKAKKTEKESYWKNNTGGKKRFLLPGERSIYGTISLQDGNCIPGVLVMLFSRNTGKRAGLTVSKENGFFEFKRLPGGEYIVLFELEGFKQIFRKVEITDSDAVANVMMEMQYIKEEIMVRAGAATSIAAEKEPLKTEWDNHQLRALLRKNFKENLFFQIIETDDTGKGELTFTTSDTLSTYHITAHAYGADIFGKGEGKIQVTRDLYLEETMPEFARKNDSFKAGVQVSNRTNETLKVDLKLKIEPPQGTLSASSTGGGPVNPTGRGPELAVPSKGNVPVYYDFFAKGLGEAELYFYARAGKTKDALLKKLPVFDTDITGITLDFDNGRTISKQIEPGKQAATGGMTFTVTPSILKPAGRIAKQLIFYPYDCMEQRASKAMPYLMLDNRMSELLEINIEKKQIHKSITEYVKIIPEYMNRAGALSYYRGSSQSSDYLTIYVYWSLQLARERGIAVEAAGEVMAKLEKYLKGAATGDSESCFYQYVLSLNKKASPRKLKAFYKKRRHLPLKARVFLYRAINNQLKRSRAKTKRMYKEFRKVLIMDAGLAYFDAGKYSYNSDWPFYSSRYATALILQAILEVEGKFEEAPRVISWLLKVPPYQWQTTQTNFWVLAAMKTYSLTLKKEPAGKAEITIAGEKVEKIFRTSTETWKTEKKIHKEAEPFNVEVKADGNVYLTTETEALLDGTQPSSRGIRVQRNVYDRAGKLTESFVKGDIYQVEILTNFEDNVPYGVVDEPIAAGFEILREDFATTRELEEFNSANKITYNTSYWCKREYSADRLIYYSYRFSGNKRLVYFIKALYSGTFTWMPTKVQGMYHPQYFGRTAIRKIEIKKTRIAI